MEYMCESRWSSWYHFAGGDMLEYICSSNMYATLSLDSKWSFEFVLSYIQLSFRDLHAPFVLMWCDKIVMSCGSLSFSLSRSIGRVITYSPHNISTIIPSNRNNTITSSPSFSNVTSDGIVYITKRNVIMGKIEIQINMYTYNYTGKQKKQSN